MWAVLLLAVTAVGVRADEEAAVKGIEKLGGTVKRDDKAPGRSGRQGHREAGRYGQTRRQGTW
jgi:hypothetical protein